MLNKKKSVFITGANGGLGKETCKWLVEDGYGHVLMACRTEAKALQAREEVLQANPAIQGTTITAVGGFDMTSPASIEDAVAGLPRDQQFDIIFLQAGGAIFGPDYQVVQFDGGSVERTLFQNVLGGHSTLALLRKYDLLAPGARVIAAGGEGARGIPGLIDCPDFASPHELRQYVMGDFSAAKAYNPMNAIGVSKLLSALWVLKLAELEGDNLSVIWFSPGLTYGTQGLNGTSWLKRWFAQNIVFGVMRLLGRAQSPRDGARKYADCIAGIIGQNGDVIGAPEGRALGQLVDQIPMNRAFRNMALRDEFWAIANEICPWDL